jgi:ATP-binding cassette subfamily B protein
MQPINVQHNFTGHPGGGPSAHLFHEKVQLHDVKGTLKRILTYLLDKKGVLLLVFVCAAVTTLITIIGTRLNGYAIDHYIVSKDIAGLALICLIMLGMYLVSVFSTYAQNALMIGVAQKTSSDIRRDLFANLQKLPLRYFDTHSSGDLMSRLTNDVDNINITLSQSVVQLFSGVIMIVGMLIAMLLLSPLLTVIGLLTMPLMFIGTKFIAKKEQPYFVTQQRELGNLNGYVEEMVSGQKAVKLFSRESEVEDNFSQINQRLTKSAIWAQGISGIMGPVNNVTNNFTYLVLTVCGSVFIIKGLFGITVGVVFSFLLYMRSFTRPINDILNLFNTIQSALAGAERVFEVIDEEKEGDSATAKNIDGISGDVELEDIGFAYIPGKQILKGVSISARSGQTIAIVGPTGAGKTTIINLLTKFYEINGGRILIDGKDIDGITKRSLRKSISVVQQDTYLFSETIRENIRYGRLDATDAEVEEAAKKAHVHEFIMQLPQGYETILTDNGGNLSQGQRQLLSIARAIIAQSSVLILDEATSSIDTRTEVDIQHAMLTLMKGKTSFVIAHRLSTIRNADKIVVIDAGRVVETGSHDELIEQKGFYARLYNSQFATGMEI